MIFINLDFTDPYFNLSTEEYIFNCMDENEDYFLLWQNSNAIVIGKYQNTIEEINEEFVKSHDIKVVRRLSGGGAVYHDLGNINYTFIKCNNEVNEINFSEFMSPVIKALNKMDLNAEFNSRNDILIDGKKISGNAQYIKKNKILHHGTLLFNSDMNVLENALNVKPYKIESKGIKSVKSRVANITDYMTKSIDINIFKKILVDNMFEENFLNEYYLTDEDIKNINKINKEKYSTWNWNYGNSPVYNIRKEKKFEFGFISSLIYVENGKIVNIKFYGDFFGNGDITELEALLINKRMCKEDILSVLEDINVEYFISGLNNKTFADFLG